QAHTGVSPRFLRHGSCHPPRLGDCTIGGGEQHTGARGYHEQDEPCTLRDSGGGADRVRLWFGDGLFSICREIAPSAWGFSGSSLCREHRRALVVGTQQIVHLVEVLLSPGSRSSRAGRRCSILHGKMPPILRFVAIATPSTGVPIR